MEKKITLPLTENIIRKLKCGDVVYLSGKIYTARDAAHKRMAELIREKKPLPFDIKDAVIYYCGPTPAKDGEIIGSAGPTTSGRMDVYTPALLDLGLKGMIGKGKRSTAVTESIKKNSAVYFGAVGGAGALIAECIRSSKIIAWEDLDSEAVRELEVENMPVYVLTDSDGNTILK